MRFFGKKQHTAILFFATITLLLTSVYAGVIVVPKGGVLLISLSGAALSADGKTITIKSGTEETVTATISIIGRDSAVVSLVDIISPPNGVQFTWEDGSDEVYFCDVTETTPCQLQLVITTSEAQISHPNFPIPPGAVPGEYPIEIAARVPAVILPDHKPEMAATYPVTLKITSGKMAAGIVIAGDEPLQITPEGLIVINVLQSESKAFFVSPYGFPYDDGLPDITLSADIDNRPPGLVVSLVEPTQCTTPQLQKKECLVGVVVSAASFVPEGNYILRISGGTTELVRLVIRVGRHLIEIIEFTPLFFEKGVAKARCKAKINTEKMTAEEQELLAVPTLSLKYMTATGPAAEILYTESKEGTEKSGVFEVVSVLPSMDTALSSDSSRTVFSCTATLTLGGRDTSVSDFRSFSPLMDIILKDDSENNQPTGRMVCQAALADFPKKLNPSLTFANLRAVFSLKDSEGKTLLEKNIQGQKVMELKFKESELGTRLGVGDRYSCAVRLELFDRKSSQTIFTATAKEEKEINQHCVNIPRDGFSGPFVINFIGLGPDQARYESDIEEFLSTIEKDPLLSQLDNVFSLKKVAYTSTDIPRYVQAGTHVTIGRASHNLKYCGINAITVILNQFATNDKEGESFISEEKFIPAVVAFGFLKKQKKEIREAVIRHEWGHIIGRLDDEYISDRLPFFTTCAKPTEWLVEGGKGVCARWKAFPDHAACIVKCGELQNSRSTTTSLMNDHTKDNRFSVVQCAHLLESIKSLKVAAASDAAKPAGEQTLTVDRPSINLEQGMRDCISNIKAGNSYNLVWEAASIVP